MTRTGAVAAAAIALAALVGHIIGNHALQTLGNKVPMGLCSILFILALSLVACYEVEDHRRGWGALPIAGAAFYGVFARATGVGLWSISPFWNISSITAVTCYFLMAWSILFQEKEFRAVTLTSVLALAGLSAIAHFPLFVEHLEVGRMAMSLPSATALLAMAGGMLLSLGPRPLKHWRRLLPE